MDKFIQIIKENNLQPDNIESVTIFLSPTSPWSEELVTQEDIFLNLPYQIACAAHGIPASHWHDPDVMESPKIWEFMRKIGRKEAKPGLEQEETGAEVIAEGKSFMYIGDCQDGVCILRRISEEELIRKFDENNSGLLSSDKRDKIIHTALNIEELEDVAELIRLSTP